MICVKSPSFKKLEFPSFKDDLCQVWLKLPSGSGENDFLNLLMYFRNFVIITLRKRMGSSFEHT